MALDGADVGVVGAGAIGSSLALLCALRGANVVVCVRSAASHQRCREQIGAYLDLLAAESLVTPAKARSARENIAYQSGIDAALAQSDMVFEAVAEELSAKKKVFAKLESIVGHQCLLGSCTSGLPADAIFAEMTLPARAVVTHFANPPLLMPAVELVPGSRTSGATMTRAESLIEALGKEPIVLKADTPGHLFNRIQFAMLREAMSLVAQGIASAEQVDKVVKCGLALRLPSEGPLEKIDLAGLRLVESVASYLFPALDRSSEPTCLRQLIADGRLGADWGGGFYEWSDESRARAVERRAKQIIAQLKLTGKAPAF
jgi:3-hydroxybutyryl-CoA dehydrogenase